MKDEKFHIPASLESYIHARLYILGWVTGDYSVGVSLFFEVFQNFLYFSDEVSKHHHTLGTYISYEFDSYSDRSGLKSSSKQFLHSYRRLLQKK